MADESAQVKFGAETSAVKAGGQEVKGVLASIMDGVQALSGGFKAMGAATVEGFGQASSGAKEAAESIKGTAEAVTAMREMISGVGEALIAAFAVEQIAEWAKAMGEAAEQTAHTAQTFGMTTAEVQRLKAEAAGAGVPFDAVTSAMTRLDRALLNAKEGSKNAAEAFSTIGVNINDTMTQTQLLNGTLEGLANMADGPAKVALATQLLGRNIQAIGPMIGLTTAQLKELSDQADAYGAVSNEAEGKGLALAESFNTSNVAMQGLGNVMTSAFAPVLKAIVDDVNGLSKAFIQSYNSGGEAKVGMDILAIAIKAVVAVVDSLITAIAMIWDIAKGVWNGTVAIFNQSMQDIEGDAKALGQVFVDVGKVIYDALSNNIVAGAQALQKTIADTAAAAKQMGADMAKELKAGADASKTNWDQVGKDVDGFIARMNALKHDSSAPLPKAGAGTTDQDPTRSPKPKKETGQESAMQALQEAFDTEENSHNDMLRDMQADELAYWTKVSNSAEMATLSDKDQAAVRMKVASLTHTEAMRGIQEEIGAWKEAAAAQIASVQQSATVQRAAIEQQIKDVQDAEKNGQISHQAATAQIDALIEQERQAAIDAANDILAIRIAADQEIMAHSASTTDAYKAALKDETAAVTQFESSRVAANTAANAQILARTRTAADQYRQAWDKTITPLVQDMGRGFIQMAEGAQSFGQVMAGVGNKILEGWVDNIAKMVSNWARSMTEHVVITNTTNAAVTASNQAAANTNLLITLETNLKKAASDAVAAAQGAYAWASAWGGPIAGAAAAGIAFAGVMGLESLASAAGGFDIPTGMNPLTQLHQQEMVLPARIANPLRDAIGSGSLGGGGGGPWGGVTIGDTHLHGVRGDPAEFRQMLREHRDEIMRQVHEAYRSNYVHKGIGSPFKA